MTELAVHPDRQNTPSYPSAFSFRTEPDAEGPVADNRFRQLLPADAWSSLSPMVRQRFSRGIAATGQRIFTGAVTHTSHSRLGLALARLARCVGGPLPHAAHATGPSTVVVTRSDALGGQIWSRTYAQPGRLPQTITTVKRFAGPTGLEEYLGAGLVMRLTLAADAGTLVFRSAGYDCLIGGRRLPVPDWLAPGVCTITHRDLGHGRFSFTLALDHPRLGRLVHQVAQYEEITP